MSVCLKSPPPDWYFGSRESATNDGGGADPGTVPVTRATPRALLDAAGRPSRFPRGSELLAQSERSTAFLHLRRGWVGLHHTLPDGQQPILRFALPGDILGLSVAATRRRAFGATALTDVTVQRGRNAEVVGAIADDARSALALCALIQAANRDFARDYTVMVSLPGEERVAYLMFSLTLRLLGSRPTAGTRVAMPLTQERIGEATGLSSVHVNRVLRRLRERDALLLRRGELTVGQPETLAKIAHIDPDAFLEDRIAA